jgi:hypothetical protein
VCPLSSAPPHHQACCCCCCRCCMMTSAPLAGDVAEAASAAAMPADGDAPPRSISAVSAPLLLPLPAAAAAAAAAAVAAATESLSPPQAMPQPLSGRAAMPLHGGGVSVLPSDAGAGAGEAAGEATAVASTGAASAAAASVTPRLGPSPSPVRLRRARAAEVRPTMRCSPNRLTSSARKSGVAPAARGPDTCVRQAHSRSAARGLSGLAASHSSR